MDGSQLKLDTDNLIDILKPILENLDIPCPSNHNEDDIENAYLVLHQEKITCNVLTCDYVFICLDCNQTLVTCIFHSNLNITSAMILIIKKNQYQEETISVMRKKINGIEYDIFKVNEKIGLRYYNDEIIELFNNNKNPIDFDAVYSIEELKQLRSAIDRIIQFRKGVN